MLTRSSRGPECTEKSDGGKTTGRLAHSPVIWDLHKTPKGYSFHDEAPYSNTTITLNKAQLFSQKEKKYFFKTKIPKIDQQIANQVPF